jgi:hypothetical protein
MSYTRFSIFYFLRAFHVQEFKKLSLRILLLIVLPNLQKQAGAAHRNDIGRIELRIGLISCLKAQMTGNPINHIVKDCFSQLIRNSRLSRLLDLVCL